MNIFNVDINRLTVQLLPTFLRRRRITHFLHAAILPLKQLYENSFKLSREDHIYRINHNSQVCSLRAVLNDTFDPVLRRITVEDVETKDWLMIYREAENDPVFLETVRIWRSDMIGRETADFSVTVPFSLGNNEQIASDNLTHMNSLIRYYKLASKRYIIL